MAENEIMNSGPTLSDIWVHPRSAMEKVRREQTFDMFPSLPSSPMLALSLVFDSAGSALAA